MSDDDERHRLLSYFSHRYVTLIAILKEAARSKRLMKGQKTLPATVANEDGVNTEITNKFTLKNKKLIDAMDFHDEEVAAVEHAKQLADYKRSRGLAPETKIFKVLGKYPVLREELTRRGMVEHDWEEIEDSNEHFFTSLAFDFCYFKRARDVFRISLAPNQQVNHIFGQNSITTKVGLTHNMKNLVWKHNLDISRVFPQSFDISDP